MAAVVHRMVPELSQDTILLNRFPLFAPVSFVFEEALRLRRRLSHRGRHDELGRAVRPRRRLHPPPRRDRDREPAARADAAARSRAGRRASIRAEVFATVRVVFCGGAVLPPALRRAIEHDWEARVVEIYGSNETMLMGVGCPRGRLHLCTELLETRGARSARRTSRSPPASRA